MGGQSRGSSAASAAAMASGSPAVGTAGRASRGTSGSGGGTTRHAARIDAVTVRVIAQTVPSAVGGGSVRDDVAAAVAADAELMLRALAARARSFMRAAHRDTLCAADVAAALRLRGASPCSNSASGLSGGGVNSARGFEVRSRAADAGAVVAPLRFDAVPSIPGLFVVPDPTVSLREVLKSEPSSGWPAPGLRASWLALGGMQAPEVPSTLGEAVSVGPANGIGLKRAGISRGSSASKRPRVFSGDADVLFARMKDVLSSVTEESVGSDEFMDCVTSLSATTAIHALAPGLVSQCHTLVVCNAHESGNTASLVAATRVLQAIALNPWFGFEAQVDNVLPPLLTVVVGRCLGTGDHGYLRRLAADALRDVLAIYGTPLRRTRVARTLVAALTGDESDLRTVHGALLGLIALGPDALRAGFLPHVPALLAALGRIGNALGEAEAATSSDGDLDVSRESSETLSRDAAIVSDICADVTALMTEIEQAIRLCEADDLRFSQIETVPLRLRDICI